MEEKIQPIITFLRSKRYDYNNITAVILILFILFLIDQSDNKYLWLFATVIPIIIFLLTFLKAEPQIYFYEDGIEIKLGQLKSFYHYKDITAVDFDRIGGGSGENIVSSGSFRIITTNEKSINLKSRGWYVSNEITSPEIIELEHNIKPLHSKMSFVPRSYNINENYDRLQLMLLIIERKSGIKPSFEQIKK